MADILSQDEVDMLLSAVSEGELEPEAAVKDRPAQQLLSTYDFRRPERVSKEQLKGLQSLFEAFSRELGIVLPPFLRTVVRVELTSIDQLTYDEFILSIARPTSLSILDMNPLEGRAVLELSPAMVFPLIDRVLGGSGVALARPRELTEIEERIVQRIVFMVLDCWKRSWEHLVDLDMSVMSQENDPLIVQIVAGSEMVVLIGYEVYIGETVGSMNICIPLLVLNPILDQISQQAQFQRRVGGAAADQARRLIGAAVTKTRVSVEPQLGQARLHLSELARLQVGDIITLDSSVNEPIRINVGGVPRFLGQPGRRKEASSVQIVSTYKEE